jgi:UDP-2,4-diacetamido-2,4,6-trideoxy-beta-L-altropyranose hydrolase
MSTSPGTLLLRADASPVIGAGHVMRCLALAQAWQDVGGTAVFASAHLPELIRERLVEENCEVQPLDVSPGSDSDLEATSKLADALGPRWLVLDGYKFGPRFQSGVYRAARQTLVIDDAFCAELLRDPFSADLIVNQNVGALPTFYERAAPNARVLAGADYVMLRREFRRMERKAPATRVHIGRILITLGAADSENITQWILEACLSLKIPDGVIDVVIGPANPHEGELRKLYERQFERIALHKAPSNLPELMAGSDLAVTAAGSSVYELAYLGVPMLLVVTAKNQLPVAAHLSHLGAAVWIDDSLVDSKEKLAAAIQGFIENDALRTRCAETSWNLIDGQGAARVVEAMR